MVKIGERMNRGTVSRAGPVRREEDGPIGRHPKTSVPGTRAGRLIKKDDINGVRVDPNQENRRSFRRDFQ
jgi:hypothetical protein